MKGRVTSRRRRLRAHPANENDNSNSASSSASTLRRSYRLTTARSVQPTLPSPPQWSQRAAAPHRRGVFAARPSAPVSMSAELEAARRFFVELDSVPLEALADVVVVSEVTERTGNQ